MPRSAIPAESDGMATAAIARHAPVRRSAASGHRPIPRKSQALHLHPGHAISIQAVSPRAAAKMSMQEQALAEIKAAWQRIEKYNLEFGKVCCEWRDRFK